MTWELKDSAEIMVESARVAEIVRDAIDKGKRGFPLEGEAFCKKVWYPFFEVFKFGFIDLTAPETAKTQIQKYPEYARPALYEFAKQVGEALKCDGFVWWPKGVLNTPFMWAYDFKFKPDTHNFIGIKKVDYDKYCGWGLPDFKVLIWSNSALKRYIHTLRNPSNYQIKREKGELYYDVTKDCVDFLTPLHDVPLKGPPPKTMRELMAMGLALEDHLGLGPHPKDFTFKSAENLAQLEFWLDAPTNLDAWRMTFKSWHLGELASIPKTVVTKTDESKYQNVLRPKTSHKRFKDVAVFGFDTEFHDDNLLSVQICGAQGSNFITENLEDYDAQRLLSDLSDFPLAERNFLIAHFVVADIGHLKDCLKDFRFKEINRAMHAEFVKPGDPDEKELKAKILKINGKRFKFVDLYAYYPYSLKTIGEMIGLPKLEADRSKILEFYQNDLKGFRAYAMRDAEIALEAFLKLRKFLWRNYGVELLKSPTIASVASDIFRTRFLKEPAAPCMPVISYSRVKTKKGYSMRRSVRYIYAGSRDLRTMALYSYWGGRAECYIHGFIKAPLKYYDVSSLYPSASLLQPLPNQNTQWLRFNTIDDIQNLEGFAIVKFEFPNNVEYPCLPVMGRLYNRLYFPLKGKSACTLSEIREAQRLGCKIDKIFGYGFKPGTQEINHDLKAYMQEMLRRKEESTGLERETFKLLANALIGKFVQRNYEDHLNYQKELYVQYGIPYQRYNPIQRAGASWSPEWGSLILGKARALMSQFICKGAFMTVTDSVLLPADAEIECPALTQLRSVGSDLVQEPYKIASALIVRTRLYALMNEAGEIVKEAHHAVHLQSDQVKTIMSKALEIGDDPQMVKFRDHIIRIKEALRTGKPLGFSEPKPSTIYFRWDWKRELLKPEINMFREYCDTKPIKDAEEFEKAIFKASKRRIKHLETIRIRKSGRPKEISDEAENRIRELRKSKVPYREIAKEVGVSLGMVQRTLSRSKS